jgi:hypothetical protein
MGGGKVGDDSTGVRGGWRAARGRGERYICVTGITLTHIPTSPPHLPRLGVVISFLPHRGKQPLPSLQSSWNFPLPSFPYSGFLVNFYNLLLSSGPRQFWGVFQSQALFAEIIKSLLSPPSEFTVK